MACSALFPFAVCAALSGAPGVAPEAAQTANLRDPLVAAAPPVLVSSYASRHRRHYYRYRHRARRYAPRVVVVRQIVRARSGITAPAPAVCPVGAPLPPAPVSVPTEAFRSPGSLVRESFDAVFIRSTSTKGDRLR